MTEPTEHLETITPFIAVVDRWLEERLDRADLPDNLHSAVRAAVLGGGKRLRPILAILCCRAVGGDDASVSASAVAVELIHAFSLVHDDLPALDNDLLRRGLPTVHAAFGEAMAILAGDALMALAFETLSEPGSFEGSAEPDGAGPEANALRGLLLAELAVASRRMISGQVLDTLGGFGDDATTPIERLERVHHNKTGALITGACRMGAIAGGADATQLEAITAYGEAVGLMFQIVDDLLDVTQSSEAIGKATNKDLDAGKLTFPGVVGIDASAERVRELHAVAVRTLRNFGDAAEPLRTLAAYMAVRTR